MSTFEVIVQENSDDRKVLDKNNYSLQVAKSVSTEGKNSYTVVFETHVLGPQMTVSWKEQYALNWTQDIPNAGAAVTFEGEWQPCKFGESFALDSTGGWIPYTGEVPVDPKMLNVGQNGYKLAVHIVIGVYSMKTNKYVAAWVNTDQLIVNAHGTYQPQESVRLYWEESNRSETMISHQGTLPYDWDMTRTPKVYYWYDTKTSAWKNQTTPFFDGSKDS